MKPYIKKHPLSLYNCTCRFCRGGSNMWMKSNQRREEKEEIQEELEGLGEILNKSEMPQWPELTGEPSDQEILLDLIEISPTPDDHFLKQAHEIYKKYFGDRSKMIEGIMELPCDHVDVPTPKTSEDE